MCDSSELTVCLKTVKLVSIHFLIFIYCILTTRILLIKTLCKKYATN